MYGKFFSSTFTGSMCGTSPVIFAVWGYVIANSISSTVELNPALLAYILGCKPEDVQVAIEYLCSPDPKSRDGRRLIREGEYQYHVVTWSKYNQIRNEEDRREYNRVKQQESRARKRSLADKASSRMVENGQSKPHVNDSQHLSAMSAHIEEEVSEEEKRNIGGDKPTLAEIVRGGLKGVEHSSFTLDYALDLIQQASVKRQGKDWIKPAFEAAIPEVVVFRKINPEAAQSWLMGQCLKYFEAVRATWPREQWKYAKKPADFLASGTWREEPVIWDRSQQRTKEREHGNNSRGAREGVAERNMEVLQRALATTRIDRGEPDGVLDTPTDSPEPRGNVAAVKSLFPNRVEVQPVGHRSGVRQSGTLAQIHAQPRGSDRADR